MAKRPPSVLYRVRRFFRPDLSPESDRALLDRYSETRDGDAFRELLDRHGALVLGVCRRVLRNNDLAEDVFQATFLVLARNPRAVRGRGAIGSWLYTIARRLAQRARSERMAERQRQQKVAARPTHVTVDGATQELLAVLNAEMEKLPDRLRAPLELCYLQGRTQEEAARLLGQSLSTVRRRLEKGLSILRLRLTRRGTTLEAALFAAALVQPLVARVPHDLVQPVLDAACTYSIGGGPQSAAKHLAQEGLKMLTHDRLKRLAVLVLGLGLLTGIGLGVQLAMPSVNPPEPATTPSAPVAVASNEDVSQRLTALWQKQRETMTRGRFEFVPIRLGFNKGEEIHQKEFDKLIADMNLNNVSVFLQRILDRDPVPAGATRGPLELTELRVDGHRRLEAANARDRTQQADRRIVFCNDSVYVEYDPLNEQASIGDPARKVRHTDDLRYLPIADGIPRDAAWQVLERKAGRVRMQYTGESHVREIEADEGTGFVHFSRSFRRTDGSKIYETRQFGAAVDQIGRVMPTVRIDVHFLNYKIDYLSVHHIVRADLDATFADSDFAVSVPAGTKTFDYRGDGASPKYKFVRDAAPDILAVANAIPDTTRPIWPRLKYGTPAPELSPAVWFTQKGKVEPPHLKGKILLVDFWGTSCGPCIAELPHVQDAAKKYAGSDLVLIGLHNAGADAKEVAEFARKRGLTYLLGIDRAAEGSDSFGATFSAFGIRGIPNAAVIDRAGKVAFIGSFDYALQMAEKLLNGKREE